MSTQKAFFSYEEVIDLHTEHDRVSVIGIHTPTGDTPRKLCPGFFQQFKKYKYRGCKVALVPAATLPADPAQVSYGAGEAPIDMRDMLNPILWHGCHGNDLGDILNRLYAANAVTGDSTTMHLGSDAVDMVSYLNGDLFEDWDALSQNITFMESLYYRALTDRTWKKANIQRGFRIAGLRPRVYSLASTMQISGTASLDAIGQVPAPFEIDGEWTGSIQGGITGSVDIDNPISNANRFMTPRTIPLGWLDTRNVLTFRDSASVELENNDIGLAPGVIDTMVKQGTVPVELPKIFMGVILLPPAYKQEFYFRMIVTHFFAFAGFRGVSMSNDMLENPNYHDWNERITDGDSDEPEPDPEPEPEPEPEPVYEYPAVFLSDPTTGGYRTATYVRSADDPLDPTRFTFAVSENVNKFIVADSPGTARNGKIVAQYTATDGDLSGQNVQIFAYGSPISVGQFSSSNQLIGDLANAAGVIDALAGDLDNSEYFMVYRGQDMFNMFLTSNVYIDSDDVNLEMKKWTPILAPSKS